MSIQELVPIEEQPTEDVGGVRPEAHESTLDVELTVCHNPESNLWQQAEAIEAGVFVEKGYVVTPEELAEEYAPYLSASTMIVAKQGSKVVGCGRMISYDESIGFKTLHDAQRGKLDIS